MESLIGALHLLVVFQIATANVPIHLLNVQPILRYPRNVPAANSNGLGILGNGPYVASFAIPDEQYPLSNKVPQYRYTNPMQNKLQQFAVLSNNISPRMSSVDMHKQPQLQLLPKAGHPLDSNNQMEKGQTEGVRYNVMPMEVVDGYIRPQTDKTKINERHKLDNIIKDRVLILQTLQDDFNKLMNDIAETALSFVSKHSYFGGATRRSLFDPSNMEYIRNINEDIKKVGTDIHQMYRNLFIDVNGVIQYISDHRNFSIKDIFANGFTTALRIFSLQ